MRKFPLWSLLASSIYLVSCERSRDTAPTPASAPQASRAVPVRLALITDLQGVLEPCGCGRSSVGGLDRLAHVLGELRQDPAPLLSLAAGNLLFAPSPPGSSQQQAQLKVAQAILAADLVGALLERLQLDVAAPGALDLLRGASQLRSMAASKKVGLLGSGAASEALDALLQDNVVRSAGGHQLVFQAPQAGQLAVPPRPAAARDSNTALVVAVLQGDAQLTAGAHPDLVVHTDLPQAESFAAIQDGTLHVSAGQHGEQLLLIELWPMGAPGSAWQLTSQRPLHPTRNLARVQQRLLDASVPQDPEVRRTLDQHFARINTLHGSLAGSADEGQDAADKRPTYVGARTCAACHTEAYVWWLRTAHGQAYETLRGRGRELDLDCIGCHVTGFAQPHGARIGRLDELKGVGCESCHGPGSKHVNNPSTRPPSVQRVVAEARCVTCHDAEHGDDFRYNEQRQLLLLPGHGARRSLKQQGLGERGVAP